jgi:mRNA-degrading endonuclease RelE of RelBE toxin-antitoxin system
MRTKLQQELESYLTSKSTFQPYYKSMKQIVSSALFEKQLIEILEALEKEDPSRAKSFKLYLDTIIINMQSKIAKYKPSLYFDNEKVKEIENQGYVIPFYIDDDDETFVLLGICKKDD